MQPPPVKPAEQEQAFRRSGGSVQEESSRRSLVGGGEKPVASKPEPPLAENKPNLPSRPSQVKAEEGNRKSLSSSLASSASSIINSKKTSLGREQENTKPADLAKADKAPLRPTLPASLSKTPSAPSIPSPSASVGSKKELSRRESERESDEKKRRGAGAGEKQEEESKSSKRSDSQLSRNPSDSSSSKNASTASVHSTNLGKPAPNLSFVARPEKPNVAVAAEEKGRGSKEEEKKATEGGVVGGGSSIGWTSEVLRGRASGAERVESTNTEYTYGTEAKESQEVADLKASVMSMQAEFNLQLSALRRELEEES